MSIVAVTFAAATLVLIVAVLAPRCVPAWRALGVELTKALHHRSIFSPELVFLANRDILSLSCAAPFLA